MLRRRAARPVSNHEDLFIQRYQWLMNWALRLSEQDRQQAEDLVHDVFMHFIVSRPNLEQIQNVDAYLYTMLKNLHLSDVRRTSRIQDATTRISNFSLTDYDSVENGLRVLEELSSVQVHAQIRDQLRRLCYYARIRKESSKAGSVLLLRFFHGYYPEEIAQVLRTSRSGVEERLRTARSEARTFLEDPASLSFMNARLPLPPPPRSAASTAEDFIEELRREIYGSREGACLSRREIERLYGASESAPVDQRTLSHIVSCPDCLDTVNRVLGLPLLANRFPMTMMSKDTRKQGKDGGGSGEGPSGAPGSGGSDELLKKVRRKAKDLFNQRPLELRISVNGFILGSQSITSRINRQTISVKGEERIGFVEIFSEKDVRLLFSCVDPPPDGPSEHKERLALSDGRSLEIVLDFSNSAPDLHVVYTDPTLGVEAVEKSYGAEDAEASGEAFGPQERRTKTGKLKPFKRFIENLSRRLTDWSFWFRPGTVTALLALILISVFSVLYWRRAPVPALTAADLLQKSAAAEESIAASHEQVVHRALQLEEKSATGQLIARRRIEVWQSADKGITARRLYDEKGVLVEGEWTRSDNVSTLYHHGAKPQLQIRNPQSAIRNREVWQLDPSAKAFSSLIANAMQASFEERGNVYVISAESADGSASSANTSAPSAVKSAILILNRSDLHAIEQTLLIRQGSDLREYKFTETTFERRVPSAVEPSVFEPEPELLSTTKPETLNLKRETALPLPLSPLPPAASAELEVEVLERLNQADAFLGEQLSVTHDADGRLRVDGVVETPVRKAEILRALGPTTKNPSVRVAVETVAEALARRSGAQQQSPAVTVQSVEVTEQRIAVDPELRRYLQGRGLSGEQLEVEMRRFIDRILLRSLQLGLHARALKQIGERFSPAQLASLHDDAHARWRAMVNQHARACQQNIEALRRELQPLFPFGANAAATESSMKNDEALLRAITRLYELSGATDGSLRRSFSLYAERPVDAPVRSAQFWRALSEAESLAAQIQNRER